MESSDIQGNHAGTAGWKDILAISTDMYLGTDSLSLVEGEESAPMISNEGYRMIPNK